jgi:energy-coupling factor transport system ATP-binding protein
MDEPIVSLKDVSYHYPHAGGTVEPALSGISVDIGKGEFVGLVGANGSGKSTMARMMNALTLPSAGEVKVAGLSTSEKVNHDRIRETVGMVFQNPDSQIIATSVGDDIAFGLENLGLPPAEIEKRVLQAAERFSLAGLLDREPHWLSGGQKQRLVLAGVVALRPQVLVLDEPTSMLDPVSRRRFHAMVEDLWRGGATIIYITHLMDELVEADRILALDSGRLVFDGPPRECFGDDDLLERASLEPPLAVRLACKLEKRGHALDPLPLTLTSLAEQVCV